MLLACIPAWSGVRGVDWAVQIYRVGFFKAQGWASFDTSWYGGYYPVAWMVTSPPLRIRAGALAAAAGAPLLVLFVLFPQWGRFPFSAGNLLFIGLVAAALHVALPSRRPTLRADGRLCEPGSAST